MKKNKGKELSLTIFSFFIIIIAFGNQLYQWHLCQLPIASFSALATCLASLLLWLFVATDWPSLLCLLSLSVIPEIGLTKIGQLSFGHTTFIFLLLTFVVTYAVNQTYFLKRLTAKALNNQWAQSHPRRFLIAFLTVVLLLSSFMSPTVIFMFLLPIYEEICQQFHMKKGDKSASYLLIALFITIAIGTAMTPINHVFSITAMSLYEQATRQSITTLQYMQFAIPTGLAIYSVLLLTITYLFKIDIPKQPIKNIQSLSDLPKIDKREIWIVGAFLAMVSMWVVPEFLVNVLPSVATFFKSSTIAFPPLIIVILLAVIKIDGKALLDIPKALSYGVHWQSMLLVGATLALGSVLSNDKIGVMVLLRDIITPIALQLSPFWLVVLFVIWTSIQTNVTSNLVTVSVVTTLALTLSTITNATNHLAIICCLIGFMSSLAFVTAPAMPYVAISIGTKWTTSKDVFIIGTWVLCWSILLAILIGYPIGLLVM